MNFRICAKAETTLRRTVFAYDQLMNNSELASKRIWKLWTSGKKIQESPESRLIQGALPLRSRYEILKSLPEGTFEHSDFALSWNMWRRQIELHNSGDNALQKNQPDAAKKAFEALIETHTVGLHPHPIIEGEIGLADLARQNLDPSAIEHYKKALLLARESGAEYAELRASLGLAYVQLDRTAVNAAETSFQRAVAIAEKQGWTLDQANSLVGVGECRTRLRDYCGAYKALLSSLSLFDKLGSKQGIANATFHLGEASRRAEWYEEARGWYLQTLSILNHTQSPITVANALDGLAEIETKMKLYDAARNHAKQSIAVAESAHYTIGAAHATYSLAMIEEFDGNLHTAVKTYRRSTRMYRSAEATLSEASAWRAIARCEELMDHLDLSVEARWQTIDCIESVRSAQVTSLDQSEFLSRFEDYYFEALISSIRNNRIDFFIVVFEALAGRRLAGMLTQDMGAVDNAKAAFLQQLTQMNQEAIWKEVPNDSSPERKLAMLIGRLALRNTLPEAAETAFEDAAASVFSRIYLEDTKPLINKTLTIHHRVLLMSLSTRLNLLIWLYLENNEPTPFTKWGTENISEACTRLICRLQNGIPRTFRSFDLAPLTDLLPTRLLELLEEDDRLLIVPVGLLWRIPWSAIRLPGTDGRFLAETVELVFSPCLALAVREAQSAGRDARIAAWQSEEVKGAYLTSIADSESVTFLPSAAATRQQFLEGTISTLVVVTHGRPAAGIIHYLHLDDGLAITPADMLGATPPPRMALICCWGAASPSGRNGDPVSIATLARVGGSTEVMTTNSELLDDPMAARFVNGVLARSGSHSFSRALFEWTKVFLARRENRDGLVGRWAPLFVMAGKE